MQKVPDRGQALPSITGDLQDTCSLHCVHDAMPASSVHQICCLVLA